MSDLLSGIEQTHLIKDKNQNFNDPACFYDKYNMDITVKTKTLTDILIMANSPTYIDHLSIDVEGAEMDVLHGIDFTLYTFGMVHIEHNWQPYRSDIRNILENNCDDIYVLRPKMT